jgi:hypothetical protein
MTEKTYGFNEAGREEYKKIAREVARRMQNEKPHRARWQGGRSGSDAIVTTIRFRIVGSDPASFTVLGFVLAWDGDRDFDEYDVQDDVNGPGQIPLGVVEVCDPMGTFFDEPDDELFNRTGWARRMYSPGPNACNTEYPPYPTRWEVFSLSCRRRTCRTF